MDYGRGLSLLPMQKRLSLQERFFAFLSVGIGHAAVHRANEGALGLVVEALAFGAFVGHDVEEFFGDGLLFGIGIQLKAALGDNQPG